MFNAAIPQHPVDTIDTTFASLGLSPEVLATVEKIGFVHPTPIQAAVIPTALTGRTSSASRRPAPARPPRSSCRWPSASRTAAACAA